MRRILSHLIGVMNAVSPNSPNQGGEENSDASDKGGVVSCWSCRGPVKSGVLFCQTCKAVQPPGQISHFSRLGMSASFDLDKADLDRRFFDLQRQLHPDRFATRAEKERALSQSQSVTLNEAHEILKDDLKRADYMVHLLGKEGPEAPLPEGCNLVSDPVILMESMEAREKLSLADTVESVTPLEERTAENIKTCIRQLSELFDAGDIEGACRLTTRLKYIKKLAEEIRQHKIRLT